MQEFHKARLVLICGCYLSVDYYYYYYFKLTLLLLPVLLSTFVECTFAGCQLMEIRYY